MRGRYYEIILDGISIMSVYSYSARRAKEKAIPDLLKSGYKNPARCLAV